MYSEKKAGLTHTFTFVLTFTFIMYSDALSLSLSLYFFSLQFLLCVVAHVAISGVNRISRLEFVGNRERALLFNVQSFTIESVQRKKLEK